MMITWRLVMTSVLASVLLSSLTNAAAPLQKTQAPGYYRTMLGDMEVTVLSDGTFPMPVGKLLASIDATDLSAALTRSFLKDPVEASVNGFLINTGTKLVLIDSGAGQFFGPTLGNLVHNLRAAGYTPDQVDEVYITHLHPDHIGGLVDHGKAVFKHATVRIAKAETDYWLNPDNLRGAPADGKSGFENANAALKPYSTSGQLKPFTGDQELIAGIRAVTTAGHTPGHSVYVVQSRGERLVLWGDLMHVASVQFANPSVTIVYDTDPATALVARTRIFADVAKSGEMVGGAHLPFPALGHLRAVDAGYTYVPVNYTSLKIH